MSTSINNVGNLLSGLTGTGSFVGSASPTFTGSPAAPTQASTDNSTNLATTAYVTTAIANAVAGVNPAVAVQAATTQASDTSGLTYNNGVSGVGATFTGSNNTALTIDGFTFTALGQRLLVKNDTQSPSGAFNGVYYVTQVQALALPPILTRALDYDTPSEMNNTGAIPVVNGTANANTSWLLTSSITTVGTSPLTYVQFSLAPSSIVTLTGTQTLTNKTLTSPTLTTPTLGAASVTSLNSWYPNYSVEVWQTTANAQSINNATFTAITWSNAQWSNPSSMWASGNPTRIVAPVAGKYLVVATVQWNAAATNRTYMQIAKNGSLLDSGSLSQVYNSPGTSMYFVQTGSTALSLAANDYLEINVYQENGSAVTITPTRDGQTRCTMMMISS